MMRPRHKAFRALRVLAVLALCLRVLVPVGYMPASLAGGWYLQWCPDGLPVEVVEALFAGEAASAAHAHHHQGHADATAQSDASPGDGTYAQCDLSGFSSDLAPAQATSAPSVADVTAVVAARRVDRQGRPPRLSYRSRAPPAPSPLV
ncbi:MAG: hypothetical protein AAFX85_03240 [Pseudomonadota bacterium]